MTVCYPAEIDVFSVPHSRMKRLVHIYSSQLSATTDPNRSSIIDIVSDLLYAFTQFKNHEIIEDELIMSQLKLRMRSHNCPCAAVCSCHDNSQLSYMLDLLNTIVTHAHFVSLEMLRSRFSRLRDELDAFTHVFLPHMKEEEEVFQPLLMRYFNYKELCQLRHEVIESHKQMESCPTFLLSDPLTFSPAPEISVSNGADDISTRWHQMFPDTILLNIFDCLSPASRARCALVCKKWRQISLDAKFWRVLSPALWSKYTGAVCSDFSADPSMRPAGDTVYLCAPPSVTNQQNRRILCSIVHYMLPLVGHHVHTIDFSSCAWLTSRLLRDILSVCVKVSRIDISYTCVGNCTFQRLPADSLSRITHLDMSGCKRISDVTFIYLSRHWSVAPEVATSPSSVHVHTAFGRHPHAGVMDIEEFSVAMATALTGGCHSDDCYDCESAVSEQSAYTVSGEGADPPPGLQYLSLSGCARVSSLSLQLLSARCQHMLRPLTHLDLSGCWLLSGAVVTDVVSVAADLVPAGVWFCNRIRDGPFEAMANCCANCDSCVRMCCKHSLGMS